MKATFTLISYVRLYKDIWNHVASETLNYECEAGSLHHRLIDPRYLEFMYAYVVVLKKHGLQLTTYHVPSHASAHYF